MFQIKNVTTILSYRFFDDKPIGWIMSCVLCEPFPMEHPLLAAWRKLGYGDKTRTQKQVCVIFNIKYPDRRISQSTLIGRLIILWRNFMDTVGKGTS
ncbi:hypothetical protein NQ318_002132 [Aromia moschata]|uniref:Uncharacterized protein n=1 Tax=Aromia moschata TaxID=1265417 RepID=A0AAV8XZU7_9CUCU|nr:hypothetical protein NQ318_002132 [Aromia moschata]